MTLFTQNTSLSHSGSSWDARKKLAGTLTWKPTLLSQHQKKPNLACTYALPFSCLHAFCILVACSPCYRSRLFTLCPCTLVTPAWSCKGLLPHSLLSLCCLLCLPCCSAGLPWQEGGSHCGRFCDYFTTVPCKDPPPCVPAGQYNCPPVTMPTHCHIATLPTMQGPGKSTPRRAPGRGPGGRRLAMGSMVWLSQKLDGLR